MVLPIQSAMRRLRPAAPFHLTVSRYRPTACVAAAAATAGAAGGMASSTAVEAAPRPSVSKMEARMDSLEAQLEQLSVTAAREVGAQVTAESLAEGMHTALPIDKLQRAGAADGQREPVVIVACGSFSPPTLMHLRLFEDAKDRLESTGKYAVIGGYLSPVHDAYGKASLVDMHHRLNMCQVREPVASSRHACARANLLRACLPAWAIRVQAAVEDSSWLMVDAWECSQSAWTRSALVLRELGKRLPQVDGRKVKVMMVSAHVDPACWCRAMARLMPPSSHRVVLLS
jgi:hypothetical protein